VPADKPADVYSFGKVVVYMLTGQTDPDRVPLPWRSLVLGCTERDPERRPSLVELERHLSTIPV
jgi:serine/threonine protein kinase